MGCHTVQACSHVQKHSPPSSCFELACYGVRVFSFGDRNKSFEEHLLVLDEIIRNRLEFLRHRKKEKIREANAIDRRHKRDSDARTQ